MYYFECIKDNETITLISSNDKNFVVSEMEDRKDFTRVLNYHIEDTPTGFLVREKTNGPVISKYEIREE